MLGITLLTLVFIVATISAPTDAKPQMPSTQNAMELELSNILESAAVKSTVPQAVQQQQVNQNLLSKVIKSSEKKSSISQAEQVSTQNQLNSILGEVKKESTISQAPQTEATLNNMLQAAVTKSVVPQGFQTQINTEQIHTVLSPSVKSYIPQASQAQLAHNAIVQPEQVLVVKSSIPFPNVPQQTTPFSSNLMQAASLQKYSTIPTEPKEQQQESQTLSTQLEAKPTGHLNNSANITLNTTTVHLVPQNVTLSNGTVVVKFINSSIAINATQHSNVTMPAKAQSPLDEPVVVMPHFKTKKEAARWKMNRAREMLQKAKLTTEQALEYARERSVKVNKDNKKDVDEIIKNAEIALVHVGEHIGLEYKHYK